MFGHGTKEGTDPWTIAVMIAGILILAGIVSVAGPIVKNICATDSTNSGAEGTGGAGTETDPVTISDNNNQESVYSEDGTPIVIKTDFGKQKLYMTDISVEDTMLIFFIENRGDFPVKMNGVRASVIIEGTVQGTEAKGGFDIIATDKCSHVNPGDRIKIIKDMKEDPRISNPNIKNLKIKITNLKFV
jgi:hypothetical protein